MDGVDQCGRSEERTGGLKFCGGVYNGGMSSKKSRKEKQAAGREPDPAPPAICTFACPHSDFPPPETSGACRTMSAVHCKLLGRNVDKNLPCHWRKEKPGR